MFHILIHTTIFINFYLYYSDSQTPTGKAEKNEVEARRWLFKLQGFFHITWKILPVVEFAA